MTKPFESVHYILEVITPAHIGGAKENDYMLGADFYFNDNQQTLIFFKQNETLKKLSPRQLNEYSIALTQNNCLKQQPSLKRYAISILN